MKLQHSILPTEPFCLHDLRSIEGMNQMMVKITTEVNRLLKQQLGEMAPNIIWLNIPDSLNNPDGMIGHFRVKSLRLDPEGMTELEQSLGTIIPTRELAMKLVGQQTWSDESPVP